MNTPRHDSHSPRLPPDLRALAARLERGPAEAPRHLRERVLGGVIDALFEPDDAPLDLLPRERTERWREAVAALAALVFMLLLSLRSGTSGPLLPTPRPQRVPVARIDSLPPTPPALIAVAAVPPPAPPLSALALRAIPLHLLEQGAFP